MVLVPTGLPTHPNQLPASHAKDPTSAEAEWVRCQPMLAPLLADHAQTHSTQDYLDGLKNGRFQLWSTVDAVIVTEIITYPQTKSVRLCLAAGKLDEIKILEADICNWARQEGCTLSEGGGRKGWVAFGYIEHGPNMTKNL